MFIRTNDKITSSQAVIFMTNSVLGAGILTLPRDVTEKMRTPDSWLSVLLGGVVVMLAVLLMVKLSQQFPGSTIFEFSQKIVGKVMGSIMSLLITVYFLVLAGFEIRALAEVDIFLLLEGTPIWAVIIPFIWTAAYLISGGINSIARLCQIIFPVSILILLLSLFFSMRMFDINHLRPFLGEGLPPVFNGLKSTMLIFAGGEVVLYLVGHMEHPEKAVKAILAGLSIPFVLYFCATVIVVGSMSVDAVLRSTWPTLDLLRSFEVTGLFFERLEFPFLVIWLMQMFCNFTIFFFTTVLGVSKIMRIKFPTALFALMPVVFIVALVPKNMNDLFTLGSAVGNTGMIIFALVTIPLSTVYLIRKKGLKPNA